MSTNPATEGCSGRKSDQDPRAQDERSEVSVRWVGYAGKGHPRERRA